VAENWAVNQSYFLSGDECLSGEEFCDNPVDGFYTGPPLPTLGYHWLNVALPLIYITELLIYTGSYAHCDQSDSLCSLGELVCSALSEI